MTLQFPNHSTSAYDHTMVKTPLLCFWQNCRGGLVIEIKPESRQTRIKPLLNTGHRSKAGRLAVLYWIVEV